MNSINATRLVLLLGSLFIIAGCAEGESGYKTIEGPGIYTTEAGRTAIVFSVGENITHQFIDDLVIKEEDECRYFSDESYGGGTSIYLCR